MKKINEKLIPEINIGTLGHVDHGKSTLVQTISGKWPATHSEELKRGITIKLGYADAIIYQCKKCKSYSSTDKCAKCMEKAEPVRTVSFVDAPGHETLMATVLAGASLMDGVLFVIAANEKCPQPQTAEHLQAMNIVGINKIVIVQTKVDLVSKEKALENYKQIKKFVKGTVAENAPIIPVSAQQNLNIEVLLEAIEDKIKTPERIKGSPKMLVVRSFDVNKPGTEIKNLKGGVLGGSLIQGKLKKGETIEIRPGFREDNWNPIETKIVGLQKIGKDLDEAGAGGLLGVLTELDPSLTRADSLAGSVLGKDLPDILNKVKLKVTLFEHLFAEDMKIDPIKEGELLMLNVGTSRTVGTVENVGKVIEINLKIPIVASKDDRVAVSRRISDRWRLIGHGQVSG